MSGSPELVGVTNSINARRSYRSQIPCAGHSCTTRSAIALKLPSGSSTSESICVLEAVCTALSWVFTTPNAAMPPSIVTHRERWQLKLSVTGEKRPCEVVEAGDDQPEHHHRDRLPAAPEQREADGNITPLADYGVDSQCGLEQAASASSPVNANRCLPLVCASPPMRMPTD